MTRIPLYAETVDSPSTTIDLPGTLPEAGSIWADASSTLDEGGEVTPTRPRQLGRYELRGELGRGAMGTVYAAFDPQLQREVAIKVLTRRMHPNSQSRTRFLREARAVAKVDHPAVVRVYEFGDEANVAWFAMDLIHGGTLRDRLNAEGALSLARALDVVGTVARGIAAAHAEGVVHRDLKPANILLDERGNPVVTDFGLAIGPSDEARITRAGQVMGTPAYMSPEQARGDQHEVGPRADVYALAVILFECLVGELPYHGADALTVLAEIQHAEPLRLRHARPDLPRSLERVIRRATAQDPEERYADASALAADLARVAAGEPLAASSPVARLLRPVRWARRHPRQVGLWTTAIVLVALAAPILQQRAAQAHREEAATQRLQAMEQRVEQLLGHGDLEGADNAFRTFQSIPTVQGTPALARGWLAQAERLEGRGDRTGQIAALARAYATSDHRRVQDEALLTLAAQFDPVTERREHAAAVATLLDRGGVPGQEQTVARLSAAAFGAALELSAAARALGPDSALHGPLRSLAGGTAMDVEPCATACAVLESEGELLYLSQHGDEAVMVHPLLGGSAVRHDVGWRLARPEDQPFDNGDHAALAHGDDQWALARIGDDGAPYLEPGPGLTYPGWYTRYLGEVSINGEHRHFIGQQHGLFDWDEGRGTPASAAINATWSDVMDVISLDMDGDGEEELAVAVAEWMGLDLRLVEPGAGLPQIARLPLGEVYGLARLPHPDGDRVAAVVHRQYARTPWFEGDDLFEGLVIVRLDGDTLVTEHRVNMAGASDAHRLHAVDLDGDGRLELVAGGLRGTTLMAGPLDALESLYVEGIQIIDTADVDHDGDDELIVRRQDHTSASESEGPIDRDNQMWVLGMGDAHIPSHPPARPTRSPVPSTGDPGIEANWTRVEAIASLGLLLEAAGQLVQLSEITTNLETRWRLLARAGELFVASGQLDDAGRAYVKAAAIAPDPVPLWMEGWEQARKSVDFDTEMQILTALEQQPRLPAAARALMEERTALIESLYANPIDVDFGQPLDSAWTIEAPGLVERSRYLELHPTHGGELARLALHRDDGPLRIELDLALLAAQWGTRFSLALAPAGEPAPEHSLLEFRVHGDHPGLRVKASSIIPRAGVAIKHTDLLQADWWGTATVTYDPFSGGIRVDTHARDGLRVSNHEQTWGAKVPPVGDVDLVLRCTEAEGHAGIIQMGRIQLSGTGVALRDARPTPDQQAALAVADGRPGDAMRSDDVAVRWLAMDALGQREEADAWLTRHIDPDHPPASLVGLMHSRPRRMLEAFARVDATRRMVWLSRAFEELVNGPGGTPPPPVFSTLYPHLAQVDPSQVAAADDLRRLTYLVQWSARSSMNSRDPRTAMASLQLGVAWAEDLREHAQDEGERALAGRALSSVWGHLASTHLQLGELDRAIAAGRRSIAVSVAPDVTRQLMRNDRSIAALHDHL